MIAKWLAQSLAWIVGMGALLFGAAGTLHWRAVWIFLATMAVIGIGTGLWLARTDPGLFAERMRFKARDQQPADDKKIVWLFMIVSVIWLIAIGLDHRLHGTDFPAAIQALGLAGLLLSTLFVMWVMRENSFAAPLVRIQSERGHRVISSGPYAFVRHPMYTATIAYFVAITLLLGSWWGLAVAPLFVALFVVRVGIEERTLVAGLPGYADYTARVRYRLVPGLW